MPPHVDDAYISYRFARNLAEGNGLVYNVGEYVEGFTNLLWTLLLAAGLELGLDVKTAAHVLGVTSGLGLLWATYALAAAGLDDHRRWIAGIPPWIVLASLPFATWTLSGMETPMFAALVTAALAAEVRARAGWMTLALALATLTRPEGVLVAAVLLGFAWLRGDELWGSRWAPGVVYASVLLALTVFRLGYYGVPLPNTFYAKVGGVREGRGLWYLQESLRTGAGYLVLPAALMALAARWRCSAVLIVVFTAYVCRVGGDAFAYARFFMPLLPVLAVLAVLAWRRACDVNVVAGTVLGVCLGASVAHPMLGSLPAFVFVAMTAAALGAYGLIRKRAGMAAPAALVAGVGLVVLVANVPLGRLSPDERFAWRSRAAVVRTAHKKAGMFELAARHKANLLARRNEPVKLVAAGGIGAIGYYTRLPILDIFGLIDPIIARTPAAFEHRGVMLPGHQRTNAAYVFERRPDYIMIPRSRGMAPALAEILKSEDLERDYEWDEEARGFRRRDLPRR